jgi:hypothetical protein
MFPFVQVGVEQKELRFLNVTLSAFMPGAAIAAVDSPGFDPLALTTCVLQSAAWKQLHGFPLDVERVVTLSGDRHAESEIEPLAAWRSVILDRPHQIFVALLLGQGGHDRLTALAVKSEGWELHLAEPCFKLEAAAWSEVFSDLVAPLPGEVWRQAWRAWCQPRNLPLHETDTCELEHVGARLRVRMGKRLADRLRALRSDALKGEAWILAGEGPLRPAARIEVIEI